MREREREGGRESERGLTLSPAVTQLEWSRNFQPVKVKNTLTGLTIDYRRDLNTRYIRVITFMLIIFHSWFLV